VRLVLLNHANGSPHASWAWSLHAQDCADAEREKSSGARVEKIVDTIDELEGYFAATYGQGAEADSGRSPVDDVQILPCAKNAPGPVRARFADRCQGSGKPFDAAGPRWEGGSRPAYDACPVCACWYGTGRGILPAHKRPT